MTTYDLYGTVTLTVQELCARVADVLALDFAEHESDYRGVYHLAGDHLGEHFEVQPNAIPGDAGGEPDLMEERFAEYPVLLYVNRSGRADERREALAAIGLVHLRRDSFPD